MQTIAPPPKNRTSVTGASARSCRRLVTDVEPFAAFAAGYDAAVSHYRRERVKQILREAGVL